jgi:predicted PurR-regulated permease PerM
MSSGPDYPTLWQRKVLWSAISALAISVILSIGVSWLWIVSFVLKVVQPILVPFAAAAVIAYLMEPVVRFLVARRFSRRIAVVSVFGALTAGFVGILFWIIPEIAHQTHNLAERIPAYKASATKRLKKLATEFKAKTNIPIPALETLDASESNETPPAKVSATPAHPGGAASSHPGEPPSILDLLLTEDGNLDFRALLQGDWVANRLPTVLNKVGSILKSSVGGFLGVFGFLISLVIIPIYLYYFLIEAPTISKTWQDYLPLRNSAFKDEVVSTINEINGYLIAFFRGQLIVSLIDGAAVGLGLVVVGLDFGLLIGLLLGFLGLIPYLGMFMCWVPALVIALVQTGGTWIPTDEWWIFPLVVTCIFAVVQKVDSLIITPKVVSNSVGLHPLTVIVSLFAWSLLMGGLLGALLAVPMTATLKVILKRYVWERRILPSVQAVEESVLKEKKDER